MKVLFLNYEYPPIGGGASIATEALLREWSKDPSIEVHLVTAAVGETLEHIRVGGEVYVHRLPIGKNPDRLHSQSIRDILVYSVKTVFFLFHFMRFETQKQPFDVTLAFFTVPCGFLAYLIRLVYGIPYIVSLRGADVPGFSEKYDTFYLCAKPLIRFLWRRATAVIPNSTGLAALARRSASSQPMQIIENGIDTTLFHPDDTERAVTPIIFLSTARLTKRKGIARLIEAFAVAVKRSSLPLQLCLIGDGEERSTLEARVRALGLTDQVLFLGRVEHEHLPSYYQRSHAFVLPSKNEGMSNSALEALASGLPLIVSGTGGMAELVTDGANGLFIDPEDANGFAEKLISLADHPETIVAFGVESRRRAEARSWSAVAQHFRSALESSQ